MGGVSVHVSRLTALLRQLGYKVEVSKAFSRKNALWGVLTICYEVLTKSFSILHVHTPSMHYLRTCYVLKILFPSYKLYLTLHNPRLFSERAVPVDFLRKFFKKLDALIVVGEHVLDDLTQHEIEVGGQIFVQNAFIEPDESEEAQIMKLYRDDLLRFIDERSPVILACASRLNFYKGDDIYGVDMCITLMAQLVRKYPNAGLVFALANKQMNQAYLRENIDRIRDLGLQDSICFVHGHKPIWPLFKRVDLHVRPTNTDGDAISLREALHFNCPSVASDCVPRPPGVVCFRTRNDADFIEKVTVEIDRLMYEKSIQEGSYTELLPV